MKRLHSVVAVAIAIVALLVAAPSQAQEKKQSSAQQSKRIVADKKVHRLILQVNTNDPAMMNLALNNATNVTQYYKDLGAKVTVEIVTFGPGLHMLRDDTSPVKARIKAISESTPSISFAACGNSSAMTLNAVSIAVILRSIIRRTSVSTGLLPGTKSHRSCCSPAGGACWPDPVRAGRPHAAGSVSG